ncbi:putative deacylase [Methylohalomonas lacus]|uniref:Deacylase n=1 Tax=Methylohalomonas lacus TaxID=398773 RepID=A0AAE3L1W6_9GAMM|nr:succinylglutamate desuccinylase/aspartoacylase family protein [Methylohalomonas lacus]MCS3903611.1 putative deacylase [Methylohalomonas lacus]
MAAALKINGTVVRPGQRRLIELAIPDLYTHTSLNIPVQVINGRQDGPRLMVSAAVHGDEINGVEIIRRLLNLKVLDRLRGSLVAVPVVNVYGFINQSRYLPDRRDLNRSFPGSESGSLAARLAHTFLNDIVAHCTHGIDLHTGAIHRENLPQIRAYLDSEETRRMAQAFGAPVVLHSNLVDGSMRQALYERDFPIIVYEAGEALRFSEVAIRAGVQGIVSVMRDLGMLPRQKRKGKTYEPLVARNSTWVRAPQSGILRMVVPLGAQVDKGQLLGVISDPFGEREENVEATVSGIVIGRVNIPLANEGEALFHIAHFRRADGLQDRLDSFQEEMDPATDDHLPPEAPIV